MSFPATRTVAERKEPLFGNTWKLTCPSPEGSVGIATRLMKSDRLCALHLHLMGAVTVKLTRAPSAWATASGGETLNVQPRPSWITVKAAAGVELPRGKIFIIPSRLAELPLGGFSLGSTSYSTSSLPTPLESEKTFIQPTSDLISQAQPGCETRVKLSKLGNVPAGPWMRDVGSAL